MTTETDDDRKRLLIWALCIVVGLASGSNYVYSAYAPQLGTELHVSSTTVNLIGLAGNLGVYSSGPVWGKIVDSRGQRIPLLLGGTFTLLGYSVVRLYLTHSILLRAPGSSPHLAPGILRLAPLLLAMFLTGAGGSAGLSASMNATAKSFPDSRRASATGAVLAGFGLSAFFFSTLGHLVYAGEAAGLLGLLAWGTGLPMLLGGMWIRPISPRVEGYERLDAFSADGDGPASPRQQELHHHHSSRVPEIVFNSSASPSGSTSKSNDSPRLRTSLSLSRSASPSLELARSHSPLHHPAPISLNSRPSSAASIRHQHQHKHHYTPYELLFAPSFHCLALVLAILCGTGLMYINNVGTIALVLARQGRMGYVKKLVSGWQSRNVGVISIWNCLGRIGGGIASDIWKARFNGERVWLLPAVAFLFILSQLAALYTTQVENLWVVSTILGGAYGCLFNVVPMLVLEWFGMAHFSQNFGWLCISPVIGGNLFNLVFGRVYDSKSIGHVTDASESFSEGANDLSRTITVTGVARGLTRRSSEGEGAHDCLLGVSCYARAFHISLLGCLIALGISVALGLDRRKLQRQRDREEVEAPI